jgi:hypothetical protein
VLGNPDPTSPYVFVVRDFQGRVISLTVPYDNTTKVINGSCTVHRDAGCMYTKVIIDVGGDGTPDTSTKILNVAGFTGDKTFTVAQVNAIGLNTLADVKAHQITCA